MQDFVNEVRTAAASSVGAYPISIAQNQQFAFYSDVNKDSYRERIRYFMSGTTLKKGITNPVGNPPAYVTSTEVVTDVVHDVANGTSSIFYYFDGSYTGVEAPMTYPINIPNVRMVEISLKLDENPQLTPAPLYVESKAMLRSYKDN